MHDITIPLVADDMPDVTDYLEEDLNHKFLTKKIIFVDVVSVQITIR